MRPCAPANHEQAVRIGRRERAAVALARLVARRDADRRLAGARTSSRHASGWLAVVGGIGTAVEPGQPSPSRIAAAMSSDRLRHRMRRLVAAAPVITAGMVMLVGVGLTIRHENNIQTYSRNFRRDN